MRCCYENVLFPYIYAVMAQAFVFMVCFYS